MVLATGRQAEETLKQIIVKQIHANLEEIEKGHYPNAAMAIAKDVDVFYGGELAEARHIGYQQGYRDRGYRGFSVSSPQGSITRSEASQWLEEGLEGVVQLSREKREELLDMAFGKEVEDGATGIPASSQR